MTEPEHDDEQPAAEPIGECTACGESIYEVDARVATESGKLFHPEHHDARHNR